MKKSLSEDKIITTAQIEAFRRLYRLTAHKDINKSKLSFLQEFTTTRCLLFDHEGRPGESNDSLFEEILMTRGMSSLIHVIWDEFELWRKERILTTVTARDTRLRFVFNEAPFADKSKRKAFDSLRHQIRRRRELDRLLYAFTQPC